VDILRETGETAGGIIARYDETLTILREVAHRRRNATLRIYQPEATVAFGRRDELNPGFGLGKDKKAYRARPRIWLGRNLYKRS